MTPMSHEELRELVPIYALDALAGSEELEVRSHLDGCRACQEFFAAYQQATGNLALVAEPLAPPDALRRRLMEAVATTPQAPVSIGKARANRANRAERPRRPALGWEQVTALVAVAALLAAAAFSVSLVRRLHQKDSQIARQHQFVQALGGGSSVSAVSLVAAGSDTNPTGQILVAAGGRSGGLVASGLADPGAKVYKLWLIVNNQPIPVETFRPDASGSALVPINVNLASMQGMAVTLETQPDVATPQGPKVLRTA